MKDEPFEPKSNTSTKNVISKERLEKEFNITGKALSLAKSKAIPQTNERLKSAATAFLDFAERYYNDALYFKKTGDYASAFGCLNYAHGWLDAGAMLGFWNVKGSELFVVKDYG
ncbi:MAG: DUF357 domain-containing protein [Candidatus Woesearchaeota archaeon]